MTASAEGAGIDTYYLEFEAPDLNFAADYTDLVTGETTSLQVFASWNALPVGAHSLSWRISRIWDVDSKLVYDGTGTLPSGYGEIQSGASTKSDSGGMGTAVYESGENGGTVELEVSDTTVSYVGSGGNPKSTKQMEQKKPTLTIKRQVAGEGVYKEISKANKNTDLLPGELVSLQIEPDITEKAGSTYGASWIIQGTTFRDYSTNIDAAQVDPKIVSAFGFVNFRWVDSGEKKIDAEYRINKVKFPTSSALNVVPLKTIELSTVLGKAGITADKKWIGLGDLGSKQIGITFNGKVETPAGMSTGTWQFVQRVSYQRFYTRFDGKKYKFSINNQYVFDTDEKLPYPYAGPFAADGKPQSTEDSPASELTGKFVKNKKVDGETFEMYTMFKSDQTDAQWVPLMKVNWGWSASATLSKAG